MSKPTTSTNERANPRILVVEDEEAIREMIAFGLDRANFDVLKAANCAEARAVIADEFPDLMVLDWMLPDMSGVEFLRTLRADPITRELPVIMLTARDGEHDKISGLDSGADDYMTKPFSVRELHARVRALLRRTVDHGEQDVLTVQDLRLNVASHRVMVLEQEVSLGPTEYNLLRFFASHPERVYSRAQLLDRVWGGNVYVEERTVDVHVRRLRQALQPHGYDKLIQTVRGAGYRFSEKPISN